MVAAILKRPSEDQLALVLPSDQVASVVASAAALGLRVAVGFEVGSVVEIEEATVAEEEGLATKAVVALGQEVGMAVLPMAMVVLLLPLMLLLDRAVLAVASAVDMAARRLTEA